MYTSVMKSVRLFLPAILWMGIIFFFSTKSRISVSDEGTVNFIFFKTLHVIEYGVLYLLLYRGVSNTLAPRQSKKAFVLTFLLTVLYAISDEIHQQFVPTREGKARDVIIDAIGAGFSWLTIKYILRKLPKKLQQLGKRWGVA